MLLLNIILITLSVLVLLIVLTAIIEPASLAIFYSFLQAAFVKNPPIVDIKAILPHADLLKENWQTIRKELELILKQYKEDIPRFHEVDKIQRPISANDGIPWRTFVLKAYGNWIDDQVKLAPKTAALIAQIPEIKSAMFSILEPGKHIPYHRGFYKGIYRYHLGLIVPKEGECYIMNGGVKYAWKEGEDILFDDTYRHAVWNNTNETRVVLFGDVLRSDMPTWLYKLNVRVFKIRSKSKRLKGAMKRSKVGVVEEPNKEEQSKMVVGN